MTRTKTTQKQRDSTDTDNTSNMNDSTDSNRNEINNFKQRTDFLKQLEDEPQTRAVARKGVTEDNKPVLGFGGLPDTEALILDNEIENPDSKHDAIDTIPNEVVITTEKQHNNTYRIYTDEHTQLTTVLSQRIKRNKLRVLCTLILPVIIGTQYLLGITPGIILGSTMITCYGIMVLMLIISHTMEGVDGSGEQVDASIDDGTELFVADTDRDDIIWYDDITSNAHGKVSDATIHTTPESIEITCSKNNEEITWAINMDGNTVLTDPYRTILEEASDNEKAVIQARETHKHRHVADDEALSECGDWVLLPE